MTNSSAAVTIAARPLLLSVLFLGATVCPAYAQASSQDGSSSGSDIIVTGTRRTERTASQSLAPIDVIDSKTLAASPSADLNDKLAASVPSFNVQRQPGFDGVIFSRPAALRNLSPDHTLVLVNGHRRHRSAYVDVINNGSQAIDLAQIPAVSIGRLEVLRDGASAQYGSDAIAGVINIILDDKPGTVITGQVGQYYAGDGFGVQLAGKSGLSLPGGGRLSFAGDYNNSNTTDRSIGVRNKVGQPDLESYHGTYDLNLPITDELQLYSFGTIGHTNGWSEFSWRSPQAGDRVFARSFYQNGPNAIYPTWSLASLYPDGFASQFGAKINDAEIRVGLKGDIVNNLTVDIGGGYGRNSINYKVRGSINATLGPLSPTAFDAGKVVSSETSANLDATYLLDAGLEKPISIGFGGAYSHDRFESIAGETASYAAGPLADLPSGSYGFPGLTPSDARTSSRDSVAGYLDIEADLTNRLTVGGSGRYEHFSDFGSNFSYKFSARYQPTAWIALRATYNTGFHAPALGQRYFTKVQTSPDPTQPAPYPVIRTALISSSDPLAAAFGGLALKPEKSKNISAGIVLTPGSGFTLTADYYNIRINDRIALTPQLRLPPGSALDRIQFLVNGYDSRNDGVDIVGTWAGRLAGGSATVSAAYNYNRTKIERYKVALPQAVFAPMIEDARPHHTLIVTGNYDSGKFHFMGRTRYYGSFVDALPFDQTPFRNQKVSPVAFVDVSAAYYVTPSTQITAGIDNLLGTYPNKTNSIAVFLGSKYPMIRPYEADGGHWYIRFTQKV